MRASSYALQNEHDQYVSWYINDILIGTETFEHHMCVLRGIFQRLTDFDFTIRISKCSFLQSSVPFLGFIIARDDISPEPRKLETIINFEEPKNKK